MQRQDVELLNSSLDRLGDTLLRGRMFEENKRHTAVEESGQASDRALREKQLNESMRHQGVMEKSATARADAASAGTYKWKSGGVQHQVRSLEDFGAEIQKFPADPEADGAYALDLSGTNADGVTVHQRIKVPEALKDDPEARQKVAQHVAAFQQFTGATPKPKGESKSKEIMNAERQTQLKSAVVDAQAAGDPDALAKAQGALKDFQELIASGGYQTVTETPQTDYEGKDVIDPATGQPKIRRSVSRREKISAPGAAVTPTAASAAPPTNRQGDVFATEEAARAAGKKAGDVVTLKGVGKVRLK